MSDSQAMLLTAQQFDTNALAREDLGIFNFKAGVEIAHRICGLYRMIDIEGIESLPDMMRHELTQSLQGTLNLFNQVITLGDNANKNTVDELLQAFQRRYGEVFNSPVMHIVAFFNPSSRYFTRAREEAGEVLMKVKKSTEESTKQLDQLLGHANQVLVDIKKVAGDAAVTQQARFFNEDADSHKNKAGEWKWATFSMAILIVGLAFGSLFMHRISDFRVTTVEQSYQLLGGKALIFIILSYMLILFGRNFTAHKHNEIVNRHRQHALQTFQALVDAAGDAKLKDVILTHAAACIFAPQETGYSKSTGLSTGLGSKTFVNLVGGGEKIAD